MFRNYVSWFFQKRVKNVLQVDFTGLTSGHEVQFPGEVFIKCTLQYCLISSISQNSIVLGFSGWNVSKDLKMIVSFQILMQY